MGEYLSRCDEKFAAIDETVDILNICHNFVEEKIPCSDFDTTTYPMKIFNNIDTLKKW